MGKKIKKNTTLSKQLKNRGNRGNMDTSNIHIHDLLLYWLGRGTSNTYETANFKFKKIQYNCVR